MKHLAAYLLLGLGGNTSPSASDVKVRSIALDMRMRHTHSIQEVLESVGIEADSERLDKLISELKGKDINEVRFVAQSVHFEYLLTPHSSSLRAPPSLPPSHPVAAVVVVLPLPAVLLLVALLRLPPPRRRRKRRRRSLTRTWVSVSSIKRIVTQPLPTKYNQANLSPFTRIMRYEQEYLGGVERATSGAWRRTLRQYFCMCLLRYPE
jgi:ribosomal protein L12E/L44/L45/RPP1/RPP2